MRNLTVIDQSPTNYYNWHPARAKGMHVENKTTSMQYHVHTHACMKPLSEAVHQAVVTWGVISKVVHVSKSQLCKYS